MKKTLLLFALIPICGFFLAGSVMGNYDYTAPTEEVITISSEDTSTEDVYTIYNGYCCTHCVVMVGRTTRADAQQDIKDHNRRDHKNRAQASLKNVMIRQSNQPERRIGTKCFRCR